MGSLSLRMQSFGRIAGLLLGLCLATATLAAPQKPTDEEECFDLFRIITSKINVRSKSRRNPGNTIGDDLCDRLKVSGMKRVPGPGHPKPEFRDGMKVGFFYNTCTDTKWYNTGLEIPEQVCCQKKTWKNIPCP